MKSSSPSLLNEYSTTMATLQTSVCLPISTSITRRCCLGPTTNSSSLPQPKIGFLRPKIKSLHRNESSNECFTWKDGILIGGRERRVVVVRANQGFGGFNGGGGGGWDRGSTTRVLWNLALAVGLTYLSMTGQLGWVLDAIVSLWLLAVLLPIVGLGAFFWFAGRDVVQGSCPNCGNYFQIFKSSMKDGPQLCPFCSQPFSVQDNKFVRESAHFSSDRSATFGQIFNGFSPLSEKGKASATTVVDIEAEVKDID